MMEPHLLEWLGVVGAAAGIFLAGLLTGRRTRPRIRSRYECDSCNHGIGYHRSKSGVCEHVDIEDDDSELGCACMHYIGERPPPSYEELTR